MARFLFSMILLYIIGYTTIRGQELTTTDLQLKPKLKDIETEMKTSKHQINSKDQLYFKKCTF